MIANKLIYQFIIKNKRRFIYLLIISIISLPIESILLPVLYGKLFNQIQNSKNITNVFKNIINNIQNVNSSGIIWMIIIVWFIVIILYYLKFQSQSIVVPKYLIYIRNLIFNNIIKNNSENFQEVKIGEQISRIMELSINMRDLFYNTITEYIPSIIAIISIVIYFLFVNKTIGFIMLISTLILGILFYFMGKRIINISSDREKYSLFISEKLNDSFSNLMNIYLNNQINNEININNKQNERYAKLFENQYNVISILIILSIVISVITFLSILIKSYQFLKNKILSDSSFISIIIISIYYLNYLINLSKTLPVTLTNLGILKYSKEFLKNILQKNVNKHVKNKISGKIHFQNIYFKYPNMPNYAIHNLNLTIYPNQIIGIVGSSGAGKSTIMKLLLKMNSIQKGNIYIDNVNFKGIDTQYLRDQIIYVNQKTALFEMPVIDNILYGNQHISTKKLQNILKKYDLDSIYVGLQKGIFTQAGVQGANLSLGMQKVTIILRSIFKSCKIIIFDEPLAGLDEKTRIKIIKLIFDLCKNKTIIIITHDKEILPYCHKVYDITKLQNK